LSRHDFLGNVRELRWALERALAASDGEEIDASHLPALVTTPFSTDDRSDLLP
jgi:DNA-binding NtrC family response regulator